LVSRSQQPLSELIRPFQRYTASGEINSIVTDPKRIFEALRQRYGDGRLTELDGLSVEYETWWFNVRSSNTEPLMRLNLEAVTPELMEEKRDEVLAVIRG